MNEVNVIGRLVLDPTLSFESEKTGVAKFCISVDRTRNTYKRDELLKGGSNITDMFLVVAYYPLKSMVMKHMTKGMRVAVNGNLSSFYLSKEDKNMDYKVKIIARNIDFLGFSKKEYLPPQEVMEKEEALARKYIQKDAQKEMLKNKENKEVKDVDEIEDIKEEK